ncbi:MAG: SDR family oxidoreductase [Terricaulis sp.]
MRLKGKTCVVTGAAQGIGRAIATAFAAEGARVIATDINAAALEDLQVARREMLDVGDTASVARFATDNPDTSVLVNCVGYVATGTLLEASPEELGRSFALNVQSMFTVMRAFLPCMIDRGGGSIINIGSVVSDIMAAPRRCIYAATKAAVIGLSKSVALDYAGQGIRCNVISPGTVETPSLHDRMAQAGDPEAAKRAFIARQLLGRLGRAEEIAAVAVLLASDEATFITGSNFVIDGGMSL